MHIKINGLKKKSGKENPFTIATNNIKYLGVTLTRKMKDMYEKSLKKEIGENITRWEKSLMLMDWKD